MSTKIGNEKRSKISNLKDLFSNFAKTVFNKYNPDEVETDDQINKNIPTDNELNSDNNIEGNEVKILSGSDSDFMDVTKKVIANFEGGYWNGSTSKNESTTKLGLVS